MQLFFIEYGTPGLPIDGDIKPNNIRFPECHLCGRKFGVGGLRYPFFVPTKHGSKELKRAFRVLRALESQDFWSAYEKFRELIAREAPKARFVPPGTEFGVIKLSVGQAVDVAVPNMGVIVCRSSIAERLLAEGFQFEIFPTIIKSGEKRVQEDYVEIFAPPLAHKAKTISGELCPKCWRFDRGITPLPVDAGSIPPDKDIFRLYESPSFLIAKKTLVEALARYEAPNIRWKALEAKA